MKRPQKLLLKWMGLRAGRAGGVVSQPWELQTALEVLAQLLLEADWTCHQNKRVSLVSSMRCPRNKKQREDVNKVSVNDSQTKAAGRSSRDWVSSQVRE